MTIHLYIYGSSNIICVHFIANDISYETLWTKKIAKADTSEIIK